MKASKGSDGGGEINKLKQHSALSFGGGVQTGALLAMILNGDFERPDVVVFADPGWESAETYRFIEFCKDRCKAAGLPFLEVSGGHIRRDSLTPGTRFAAMPFHMATVSGIAIGMGRRQCTREYKVDAVYRGLRKYFEIEKGRQIKPPIINWLGISMDEVMRMKESQVASVRCRWPLIEMKKTRQDCLDYLEKAGWPRVVKSACIGCPYHSDGFWVKMKRESPAEWEDACEFDEAIRTPGVREHLKLKSLAYLHPSRKPLREAPLGENQLDMFGNECEGHCGL